MILGSFFALAASVSGAEPEAPAAPVDLFLLVGQSNMAGRGEITAADREPIAGAWVLDARLAWAPAVDPLHYDKPKIAGVGLGCEFARTVLAARPGMTIGLIPAAVGGTSLDEWVPGKGLYQDALVRTRAALKLGGRLRGILWHQGEAEAGDKRLAETYAVRWQAFINQLRADLGAPDVPVIVGELGYYLTERINHGSPYARVVNEQLNTLPKLVPGVVCVNAEGLKHKGDELHFDGDSLHTLGRRYAQAWLEIER